MINPYTIGAVIGFALGAGGSYIVSDATKKAVNSALIIGGGFLVYKYLKAK